MPLYEYKCSSCGTKFELLRSFSNADKDARCPSCNSEAKRAVSVFAAVGKTDGDESFSIGGGGCAGCAAGSCDTCH